MGENGKITIYDIARETGVSASTVSRVYNGYENVSAKKREEIEALLKKYNYVPDAVATGLRKTCTKTLGVIASDLRNPFFSHLLIECEKIANLNGYTIFSCDSLEVQEMEIEHFRRLANQKVDAVIQIGGSSDRKQVSEAYFQCIKDVSARIPIISAGYAFCDNCYSVRTDEARAMRTLLEYLIDLGHREIAFVGGKKEIRSTHEKREQYRETMLKRGLPFREEYVIEGEYDKESGYYSVKKLLEGKRIPSAIIMINEMTAVGAMKAVREKGFGIPEDMSMVCFDNTYISETTKPALTTVGCNYAKFAQKLIYTALDAAGERKPEKLSYVESVFVIRDSAIDREERIKEK